MNSKRQKTKKKISCLRLIYSFTAGMGQNSPETTSEQGVLVEAGSAIAILSVGSILNTFWGSIQKSEDL